MDSDASVQRFERVELWVNPPGELLGFPSGRRVECLVRDCSAGGLGILSQVDLMPDLQFRLCIGKTLFDLVMVWGSMIGEEGGARADGVPAEQDRAWGYRYGFRLAHAALGPRLMEAFARVR